MIFLLIAALAFGLFLGAVIDYLLHGGNYEDVVDFSTF